MVRGNYCEHVMTFFFFFGLQLTARLKLQFQSGTPFKSLDPPVAIITNSPVGCAFRGSDECRSSGPCLFNQATCLPLHTTDKTIRGVNFPYQHFL